MWEKFVKTTKMDILMTSNKFCQTIRELLQGQWAFDNTVLTEVKVLLTLTKNFVSLQKNYFEIIIKQTLMATEVWESGGNLPITKTEVTEIGKAFCSSRDPEVDDETQSKFLRTLYVSGLSWLHNEWESQTVTLYC